MNTAILISLIMLMIIVGVHIAVIARWSGKIDGYILAASEHFHRIDAEIEKLRMARHDQDGRIQRHEGLFKDMEHRRYARETPSEI